MGFTIGMPSMKLSNVQGNGGKHCGNFTKVAKEALKERQGVDDDIDPNKADQNIYEGFQYANDLIRYSSQHIKEINEWRAANGVRNCDKRKLRSDTVVMCVTIFKPPAQLMKQLSADRQLQLLKDCIEIFKTFVGAQNIKAVAYHRDEVVWHAHVFWEPMTDEHRICAKEMHNSIFFEKLNRKMPKLLREKGWKMIDDCHMYDAEEEQKLKEEMGEEKYREYRRQKKANRGRDSKTFKHDVEIEIEELNQQKMSLTEEKDTLAAEVETLREEAQSLINSVSELQTEKDKLTEKTKELRTEKESLSDEIEDLKKESDLISYNIESLNEEKDFELSRIEKLKSEEQKISSSVDALKKDEEAMTDRIVEAQEQLLRIVNIPQQPKLPEPLSDYDTWKNDHSLDEFDYQTLFVLNKKKKEEELEKKRRAAYAALKEEYEKALSELENWKNNFGLLSELKRKITSKDETKQQLELARSECISLKQKIDKMRKDNSEKDEKHKTEIAELQKKHQGQIQFLKSELNVKDKQIRELEDIISPYEGEQLSEMKNDDHDRF